MFISYNQVSGFKMEPTSNKESLLVFIIRICVMVTLDSCLNMLQTQQCGIPYQVKQRTLSVTTCVACIKDIHALDLKNCIKIIQDTCMMINLSTLGIWVALRCLLWIWWQMPMFLLIIRPWPLSLQYITLVLKPNILSKKLFQNK